MIGRPFLPPLLHRTQPLSSSSFCWLLPFLSQAGTSVCSLPTWQDSLFPIHNIKMCTFYFFTKKIKLIIFCRYFCGNSDFFRFLHFLVRQRVLAISSSSSFFFHWHPDPAPKSPLERPKLLQQVRRRVGRGCQKRFCGVILLCREIKKAFFTLFFFDEGLAGFSTLLLGWHLHERHRHHFDRSNRLRGKKGSFLYK